MLTQNSSPAVHAEKMFLLVLGFTPMELTEGLSIGQAE